MNYKINFNRIEMFKNKPEFCLWHVGVMDYSAKDKDSLVLSQLLMDPILLQPVVLQFDKWRPNYRFGIDAQNSEDDCLLWMKTHHLLIIFVHFPPLHWSVLYPRFQKALVYRHVSMPQVQLSLHYFRSTVNRIWSLFQHLLLLKIQHRFLYLLKNQRKIIQMNQCMYFSISKFSKTYWDN